jgi:hypothetical protein
MAEARSKRAAHGGRRQQQRARNETRGIRTKRRPVAKHYRFSMQIFFKKNGGWIRPQLDIPLTKRIVLDKKKSQADLCQLILKANMIEPRESQAQKSARDKVVITA